MKMMSSTAALIIDGGAGRFDPGFFVNCLQCEKCIVSGWLNTCHPRSFLLVFKPVSHLSEILDPPLWHGADYTQTSIHHLKGSQHTELIAIYIIALMACANSRYILYFVGERNKHLYTLPDHTHASKR